MQFVTNSTGGGGGGVPPQSQQQQQQMLQGNMAYQPNGQIMMMGQQQQFPAFDLKFQGGVAGGYTQQNIPCYGGQKVQQHQNLPLQVPPQSPNHGPMNMTLKGYHQGSTLTDFSTLEENSEEIRVPLFSSRIQFKENKGSILGGRPRHQTNHMQVMQQNQYKLQQLYNQQILNNPFAPQNHEEQRLNQQQNPLASNRLSVYNPNIMLAGALAQPNHQASNNGLNGMVSEDVFVSYIYKSQKDNGLNFGIVNNQNPNKVLGSQGQNDGLNNNAQAPGQPQNPYQQQQQFGSLNGGLEAAASQQMDIDPYNVEDYAKLAEFYLSLMPKNNQIYQSRALGQQARGGNDTQNIQPAQTVGCGLNHLVSVKDLPHVRASKDFMAANPQQQPQNVPQVKFAANLFTGANANVNTGQTNEENQQQMIFFNQMNQSMGWGPSVQQVAPQLHLAAPQQPQHQQQNNFIQWISQQQSIMGNNGMLMQQNPDHQFKQSWKNLEYLKHSDIIKVPYNIYLIEKHCLFLSNFQMQFERGQQLMEIQMQAQSIQNQNGGMLTGYEVFTQFSATEIEKIQKFVLKDNFNKKKKTLVFELEGVLVNLLSEEEARSYMQPDNASGAPQANAFGAGMKNESKQIIQIKSTVAGDNNIISNKEYFVQFRPYLLHMLRALKPFFELVIFTYKTKEEAESIINEIEKDQNFFAYIIPVNYCYFVPSESVYVKDLSIFYGNRNDGEVALVTSQAYDGILQPTNSIPVEPFLGDESERLLLLLEVYLMSLRWSKDVRTKLRDDFSQIYKNVVIPASNPTPQSAVSQQRMGDPSFQNFPNGQSQMQPGQGQSQMYPGQVVANQNNPGNMAGMMQAQMQQLQQMPSQMQQAIQNQQMAMQLMQQQPQMQAQQLQAQQMQAQQQLQAQQMQAQAQQMQAQPMQPQAMQNSQLQAQALQAMQGFSPQPPANNPGGVPSNMSLLQQQQQIIYGYDGGAVPIMNQQQQYMMQYGQQ